MRTGNGQRVQLRAQGPAAAQAQGLTTGMRIQVAGTWMHPEARPGQPKPSPYFMIVDVNASSSAAKPSLQPAVTNPPGGVASAAAAAGQPAQGLARMLSTNQLVSQDVKTIFIPSEVESRFYAGGRSSSCMSLLVRLSSCVVYVYSGYYSRWYVGIL